MRRPFAVLAALLALLCSYPAAAQSSATQSPTLAPEALAAARELVVAAHAADNLKTLLPIIMKQLKPAIVQGRAEIDRDYDAIMPQLLDGMLARTDAFLDAIAVVYARNLTIDEMKELTAFYRSPIGQSFLQKMPVIFQESMTMGRRFGEEAASELHDHMIEELRKRGHNL
jgi:hypothetical protein